MMRISVFLLYHILMLVFTFVLLLLLIAVSAFFLFNITAFLNRLGIVLLILLGACWVTVVKNGFQLLRSPFIVTRYERDDHVEVTEEECPLLFKSIRDVAAFTGCDMPKHVYLSPDVNACLFYNTSFWNIFFPVEKQLEIGVGLMNCMSSEELKSIIAHEFGHYTQKTGKIDGIINRTITVLDNMMRNLALPGFLQKLTLKVYRFVQRGNLRFSRQLEYNADSVSCACVGKDVFVSAMCKVEILAERQQLYEVFVSHLLNEKKQYEDYWDGYDRMIPYFEKNDAAIIEFNKPLVKPISTPSKLPSRLKVNDIWSSHPSLEDRIREADKTEEVSCMDGFALVDARTLVSDKVLRNLGLVRLNAIKKKYTDLADLESITPEQFDVWAERKQDQILIPAPLVPFLQSDFCSLVDMELLGNLENINKEYETDNPFTIENMSILKRYQTEVNDLSLMQSIKSGLYEVTEFLYNGALYNRKTNPIEEQIKEVDALRPKAAQVYNAILSYLLTKTEDKPLMIRHYEVIRYTQQMAPKISKLVEIRDTTIARLNAVAQSGNQIEKFLLKNLLNDINHLSASIGSVTKELDYDLLSDVLNSASISYLSDYHMVSHYSSMEINRHQVNAMSRLVDVLYKMHKDMYNMCSDRVMDEIRKLFPEESLNILFEHIKSQSDYDFEQTGLDAEFMERVEKSEFRTVVLCLFGELATLVALFFIIHTSFGTISNYFSGPDYVVVTARDGEQSDGLMAFMVPVGFDCEHFEETDESAGGYLLYSPDCSIELYGGVTTSFDKNDCISLWNSFAEGRGYPVDANLEVDNYSSTGNDRITFWRQTEMGDDEGNAYQWDFKIIYADKLLKFVIISTLKTADCEVNVDMSKVIRLE